MTQMDQYMKDGTLIVNGSTNNGNRALDYGGKFEATGGVIVAAGSLGMVQGLSSESTQNSIKISLLSQEANTLVHVESESGEEIGSAQILNTSTDITQEGVMVKNMGGALGGQGGGAQG